MYPLRLVLAPTRADAVLAGSTALARFVSALEPMNLDQQIVMDTCLHSYSERIETEREARANPQREVRDEVEKPTDGLQE